MACVSLFISFLLVHCPIWHVSGLPVALLPSYNNDHNMMNYNDLDHEANVVEIE